MFMIKSTVSLDLLLRVSLQPFGMDLFDPYDVPFGASYFEWPCPNMGLMIGIGAGVIMLCCFSSLYKFIRNKKPSTETPVVRGVEITSQSSSSTTTGGVSSVDGSAAGFGGIAMTTPAPSASSTKAANEGLSNILLAGDVTPAKTGGAPMDSDTLATLKELGSLKVAGVLTQEEFETQKKTIMDRV